MKTIALRFSENFSPTTGTIAEHQKLIDELGFVWYGKLGTAISTKVVNQIMQNEEPKILLIHSGKVDRYWARVSEVSRALPEINEIPEYYRDMTEKFQSWFKVIKFEEAPRDVMSHCVVASSQRPLSEVSKYSMSPYFIIDYEEAKA